MFGYITPCVPELKVRDRELYQAYYCGLCRQIGQYGNLSRVCLTYDGAFLAMLLQSICKEQAETAFTRHSCAVHLMKGKRPVAAPTPAIDFAAAVCVMLAKHKLRDDIRDGKPSRRAALPLVNSACKKASLKYGDTHAAIVVGMDAIADIESNSIESVDAAPLAFSNMLRNIVLTYPAAAEHYAPLGELARGLGGFIYVCDAWDDREDDKKRGCYNIFNVTGYGVDCAEAMLDMYINAVCLSYDLLEVGACKSLLNNIIYDGLVETAHRVLYCKCKKVVRKGGLEL